MIKILYIRDRFGKSFGTVAYDISNRRNGSIKFAVAACNPADPFSKDIGIEIAKSRLESSANLLKVRPDCPNMDVVKAILTKISRSDIGSSSVRKLTRKMLNQYNLTTCTGCCC